MSCAKKNDSQKNNSKFEKILFNMGFYSFMPSDFPILFVYRLSSFFKNNFRESPPVIG